VPLPPEVDSFEGEIRSDKDVLRAFSLCLIPQDRRNPQHGAVVANSCVKGSVVADIGPAANLGDQSFLGDGHEN
jgi:hypothetical protein